MVEQIATALRSGEASALLLGGRALREDCLVAAGRIAASTGAKMLGEVNGEACRSYRKKRRNRGGARRDLEDLRAAIGHHAGEGYHREIVKVSLPEKVTEALKASPVRTVLE